MKIKDEINTIPIPPTLHQRSVEGIQKASLQWDEHDPPSKYKFSIKKLLVASMLGTVLLTSAIFHTQVIAAIQKVIQYIPGIGVVMEKDTSQDRYVLSEPIVVKIEEGEVVITGIMVDSQEAYITMSGTKTKKYKNLILINDQEVEYSFSTPTSVWTPEQWAASFWYKGKLEVNGGLKLVIGDSETIVPIVLTRVDSFNSIEEMGVSATTNDVSITAITNRIGDKARISLIAKHSEEFGIANFGYNGVHDEQQMSVVGKSGVNYILENYWSLQHPAREFFFDLSDDMTETYSLNIPEINVKYHEKTTISIDIPPAIEENVNLTFEIAGFPVTITKLERINDNSLKLYLDTHYNENAPKSLHFFVTENLSFSAKVNEQTRALEEIEFDIEPNSKKVSLTFIDPQVIIRGPWSFELMFEE